MKKNIEINGNYLTSYVECKLLNLVSKLKKIKNGKGGPVINLKMSYF